MTSSSNEHNSCPVLPEDHSPLKEPGSLEKLLIPGLGQRKYKLRLKYSDGLEHKKVWGHVKKTQKWLLLPEAEFILLPKIIPQNGRYIWNNILQDTRHQATEERVGERWTTNEGTLSWPLFTTLREFLCNNSGGCTQVQPGDPLSGVDKAESGRKQGGWCSLAELQRQGIPEVYSVSLPLFSCRLISTWMWGSEPRPEEEH